MSIILDFRFAIFDRGWNGEILTQRRKGAGPQRGPCRNSIGRRLAFIRQTGSGAFGLCVFASLRLGVKVVKADMAKIAGSDEVRHLTRLNTSKTRVNTLKYGYARVSTGKRKIFFRPAPKAPCCQKLPAAISSCHPIDNL
jgi:hypothetical protein